MEFLQNFNEARSVPVMPNTFRFILLFTKKFLYLFPMQNIELKARYGDFDRARQCVQQEGGRKIGTMHQRDVYFYVPRGRLKLRIIDGAEGQLIFYHREDQVGPRRSDFDIAPCDNPAQLERVLGVALGVRLTVVKQRELHLIDNVRVHLDEVEGLGRFLEFEAVLDAQRDTAAEQRKLQRYLELFGIAETDLVPVSYADLLGA